MPPTTDPALLAIWHQVVERLERILSFESLPEASVRQAREWLDHNELGLAWEELREHEEGFSAESRGLMREAGARMGLEPEEEPVLHARALALSDGPEALALWIDLAARGNPDAPDALRRLARCGDPALRDPAREALEAMELSHDEPMP